MLNNVIHLGFLGLLIFASLLITSCGGGGSSSSSGGGGSSDTSTSTEAMSATQAESFAKSISLAATSSMGSSAFKVATISDALLPEETQHQDPLYKAVYAVSCTQTSCLINQPITASRTCASGGRIAVSGNISGNISNSGSGLILISATETISDWSCVSPMIINGDPYISLSGQFSFLNGVPSTQQRISINGGFKWGTTAAQSYQIHLDTNFNRSGGGTTTGTMGPHTVYVTF